MLLHYWTVLLVGYIKYLKCQTCCQKPIIRKKKLCSEAVLGTFHSISSVSYEKVLTSISDQNSTKYIYLFFRILYFFLCLVRGNLVVIFQLTSCKCWTSATLELYLLLLFILQEQHPFFVHVHLVICHSAGFSVEALLCSYLFLILYLCS